MRVMNSVQWISLPPAQIRTELGALQRYATPERGAPGHTACLLLPASEAEVGAVLAEAQQRRQPVVISAGRTGLVEAQRPEGETVLSLEKLVRPLELALGNGARFVFTTAKPEDAAAELATWWQAQGNPKPGDARITVEAGLAVDALNQIIEPLGLVWPMEMGSTSSASVGGCVANASAGANAVCYGTTAHLCDAAWGYFADGSAAGPFEGAVWQNPAPQVLAIDSAAPDVALGLIGTQGVLGVITRVRLRLHALPAQREAALIPVADMPAAMRVLSLARDVFGHDVEEFEFISQTAMQLVRALKGDSFRLPFERDPQSSFYLLLQIKSDDASEDLAGNLYNFLGETLALPDDQIGYAPIKALKAIRHSITEASNHAMKALGGGRLAFDTATPVAVFGDYLADLEAQLHSGFPQVQLVAFGHAGVGGAHLHLLGTVDCPVARDAEALIAKVFDVTAAHGGTFSAEHGVGSKWGEAFAGRALPSVVAELVAAKRAHDPAHILNPRCFGLDRLVRAA